MSDKKKAVKKESNAVKEVKAVEVKTAVEDVAPVERHERRAVGTGSVWQMPNGRYGWCIQLTSDRTLKAMYPNKLRTLGSAKTYEEASLQAQSAIANRDELLKAKLTKLGHVFDIADKGNEEKTDNSEGSCGQTENKDA